MILLQANPLDGTFEVTCSAGAGTQLGYLNLTNAPSNILPSNTSYTMLFPIPGQLSNNGNQHLMGYLYYNGGSLRWEVSITSTGNIDGSSEIVRLDWTSFTYMAL